MELSWDAIVQVAEELGVEPCFITAVADVESAHKGVDAQGRVTVRFEKHVFKRELRKAGASQALVHAADALSGVRWETVQVAQAMHPEAALKATSFGLFQIMGFNYALAGFQCVEDFVAAQQENATQQLSSFCRFAKETGLIPCMRKLDFTSFARRYNGPAYAKNAYDTKLHKAFELCRLRRKG